MAKVVSPLTLTRPNTAGTVLHYYKQLTKTPTVSATKATTSYQSSFAKQDSLKISIAAQQAYEQSSLANRSNYATSYTPSFSSTSGNKVAGVSAYSASSNSVDVTVNGRNISAGNSSINGYKKNGMNMVAIKPVLEELGGRVSYEQGNGFAKITLRGEDGSYVKLRISSGQTTYAGAYSKDGDNEMSITIGAAEIKNGTTYVSDDVISRLYAVKVTSNPKGNLVSINSSINQTEVNGNRVKINSLMVRDHKLFATPQELLWAAGFQTKYEGTTLIGTKGDTRVRYNLQKGSLEINENHKVKKSDVKLENFDHKDVVSVSSFLNKLPDTDVDWDQRKGTLDIDTSTFDNWENRAGSFIFAALAEMAVEFVFSDVKTLFDPKATKTEKTIAGASLIPAGKALKIPAVAALLTRFGGDGEHVLRMANLGGNVGEALAESKKAVLFEGNSNWGWKHIKAGHVGDPNRISKDKSIFPSAMSERDIMNLIMDQLNKVNKPTSQKFVENNAGTFDLNDVYDITFSQEKHGIKSIRIVVNQNLGTITTAYPLSGSKVVKGRL
jgi:hypothetical protein